MHDARPERDARPRAARDPLPPGHGGAEVSAKHAGALVRDRAGSIHIVARAWGVAGFLWAECGAGSRHFESASLVLSDMCEDCRDVLGHHASAPIVHLDTEPQNAILTKVQRRAARVREAEQRGRERRASLVALGLIRPEARR